MFFIWAAILVLIAIIAAAFGFTDIAPGASEVCTDCLLSDSCPLFALTCYRIHSGQKGNLIRPRLRHQCELGKTAGDN